MDGFSAQQVEKAQKTYGVETPSLVEGETHNAPGEPNPLMSSTLGSAGSRLAWKTSTLAGASLSRTNFGSVVNFGAEDTTPMPPQSQG